MKEKIAVLVIGEIRTSSLGMGTNTSFCDSFKKYLMNEKIMNEFEINVFFVTDKICLEKAKIFFGDCLKSILTTDTENINVPLELNIYIDKYQQHYDYRKLNIDKYPIVTNPRNSYIYMFYKLYCASYLMNQYEIENNIRFDIIIKIRPDFFIINDIYEQIKNIKNKNKYLIMCWDWGYISNHEFNNYLSKLIFNYGEYNYGDFVHDENLLNSLGFNMWCNYKEASLKWSCWSESPEVQFFEHIIKYIKLNDIDLKFLDSFHFCGVSDDRKNSVNWNYN